MKIISLFRRNIFLAVLLLLVGVLFFGSSQAFAFFIPPKIDTTTVVVSSTNPSIYGSSITLTATITRSEGTHSPTGSVSIKDGSSIICTDHTHSLSGNSGSVTGSCSTSSLSAGTHSITALYSGDDNFNDSTSSTLSQVVNKKSLTVTGITANDKTYDGDTHATISTFHAHLSGVINNDDVDLHTVGASGTFSDKNVGHNKTVNISGLTIYGNDSDNYSLTQPTTNADIFQLHITVTAVTDTKTYDGTTASTGIPTISPSVATGDTANFSQAFDTADVGTGKTLTPSGTVNDGNSGNNYSYTFQTNTTGVISKASATITVTPYSVPFDGSDHTATGTAFGVLHEDLSSLLDLLTSTLHNAAGTFSDTWNFAGNTNYNSASDTITDVITNAPACDTNASNTYVSDTSNTFSGTDNSGNAVAVTTPVNSAWTANILNATWIWSTAVINDPTITNTETFTKTFNITGTPQDSSLQIAADNTYSVNVNGNADTNVGCVDTTGSTFSSIQTCDVPALMLQTGSNTLAITVTNTATPSDSNPQDNPAGLLYSLTVNENDCPITPPTPTVLTAPMITTPSKGATVTSAALTEVDWTSSTGGTAPYQYQYEAYSDAAYTTLIYSSGWLSSLNIPTSGTPDGTYFVRVRAEDSAVTPQTSAWSNDSGNPYEIIVSDPAPENPTPVNQTITFGQLDNKTVGDPNFDLSATATSGLDVTFATGDTDTGICSVSENTVSILGAGTCTITASQAGNDSFNPAPDVPQSFIISTPENDNPDITQYTLTYTTDGNGTISGTTPQTVDSGSNGTTVTAVPNFGFSFVSWSDGSTANPRTDINVTSDISVTANFAADNNNNGGNDNDGGNNNNSNTTNDGGHGHPGIGGSGGGNGGRGQVLGAETFKFTEWMSITWGSHASEVPELQQVLTTDGFYTGPISGVFDQATKTAVKAYQAAHPPLRVDGIVGPKTRAVLNQ